MRIREGFISNSSSTSYLVAVKRSKDVCPHCGRSDTDFLDILEGMGFGRESEETRLIFEGNDALESVKKWGEEAAADEALKAAKKAQAKGYTIAQIEISYHDQGMEELFKQMRQSGALKVLWRDDGCSGREDLDEI